MEWLKMYLKLKKGSWSGLATLNEWVIYVYWKKYIKIIYRNIIDGINIYYKKWHNINMYLAMQDLAI